MKAIYNVTGEVVDIEDMSIVTYKSSDGTYVKTLIKNFTFLDAEKDYYTKLEYQYAGMAMQQLVTIVNVGYEHVYEETAMIALNFAHALVEKLKNSNIEKEQ